MSAKKVTTRQIDESQMTSEALEALANAGFSRRSFLKGAGALVVSFSAAGVATKLRVVEPWEEVEAATLQNAPNKVDSFIAIAKDGSVTGFVGKLELGQGYSAVHRQLIADELYVPLNRIKVFWGDTATCPDQGSTAGSQSTHVQFGPTGLRQALATAREELFKRAAVKLGVPVDQLTVKDGVISVKSDPSKSVSYGDLIGGQVFNIPASETAKHKDPTTWTVLGTSVKREDLSDIVTGKFTYIHNLRLPGMLHGRVVRPPVMGAQVISVDESSVKDLPGFVKVVVKKNFVGVIAEKQYQAIRISEKLKVNWSAGTGLPKQKDYYSILRNSTQISDSKSVDSKDVDQKMAQAAKVVKATYYHPYQMHASMASSCAVADVKADSATIYCGTRSSLHGQRDTMATLLGLPPAKVRAIYVMGAGGYGSSGRDTVTYDATLLSQAVLKPVRVQVTRANEMAWGDTYGIPYVTEERLGLDAQGTIIAWDHEAWNASMGAQVTNLLLGNLPAPFVTRVPAPEPTSFGNGGNAVPSYVTGRIGNSAPNYLGTIESQRVYIHAERAIFWTGALRSPNRLQNTWAHESIMDEAAASIKTDPVQFRLKHLKDERMIDVVKAAAKAANWDTRSSPKPGNSKTGVVSGRGFACVLYEGDNGYVGMVAEVEVNQDTGKVVCKRVVCATESGPILNPEGFKNQNEGGTIQGLSRALMEEVTWDEQKVTSVDWISYPVIRFTDGIPVVESVLLNRPHEEGMGAGEVTITTIAVAVANAIFDATGARIREIPFTPARVLAALKART